VKSADHLLDMGLCLVRGLSDLGNIAFFDVVHHLEVLGNMHADLLRSIGDLCHFPLLLTFSLLKLSFPVLNLVNFLQNFTNFHLFLV
jgi:hypothetical protein